MNDKATIERIYTDVIVLLKQLIATPSLSKEEGDTGNLIQEFFSDKGIKVCRKGNNIWCRNKHYNPNKKTVLLNSHHDTVKPNSGYTKDPFMPVVEDGKLYGLGSNDAGGALVTLLGTFLYYFENELPCNLLFLASAEEEISGAGGIESVLPELGTVDCALVGEPTGMEMAIAEKGLLVLDCVAKGKAGHAARNEGENAIYKALDDIALLKNHAFSRVSELLGPVKLSVTVIEGGNLHNMVPESCRFVMDIRINELYTHHDILEIVKGLIKSEVTPRSMRLRSSIIPKDHELVKAGLQMGKGIYGSPTLSDKALMPFPALKMGPGKSERSHTADEFIYLSEIEDGLAGYIQLLENFFKNNKV